jgi:hypothetical protein
MKIEQGPDAGDTRSSKPFGVEVNAVSNRGRLTFPSAFLLGIRAAAKARDLMRVVTVASNQRGA